MDLPAYIGERITGFNPTVEQIDKSNYLKGYYVSRIAWQNNGSNWWYGMEFQSPRAIDNLIFALVYAKQYAEWQSTCSESGTMQTVRNSGLMSCEAIRKGETYTCEFCGTPHPLDSWQQYGQGKPKFCMNCGAKFSGYKDVAE